MDDHDDSHLRRAWEVWIADRPHRHAPRHAGAGCQLADYAGSLQADAYVGFRLYAPDRRPGPVTEAACWAHGRRKLFELADVTAKARGNLAAMVRADGGAAGR
jgi:hypothetical protein